MPLAWSLRWNWLRKSGYRILETSDFTFEKPELERALAPPDASTASLGSVPFVSSSEGPSTYTPRRLGAHLWFLQHSALVTAANILVFLTSLVLFINMLLRQPNEINHDLKKVSLYSPILDQAEIPFVDKQVQGELFPSDDPLIGRLEPGPAADELWQDYEVQRSFVLSRGEVIAMGKDPAKSVKYPDGDFGFGDEAYMAGMDIFHQLHCFDTIRKEAFKDYYWDGERYHMEGYGPETGKPHRKHTEIFWLHMRHCTDIIVQALMCKADASMTTMTWLETQDRPFPDFSINRKCVDFDALVKWRDENALNVSKVGQMKKPQGADQTKISEWYWKLYGNETIEGDNRHHPLWD